MKSDPSIEDLLTHLAQGEIRLEGRFLWGSNYTFLVKVRFEGKPLRAVYKPSRGERPLWDFPEGTLAEREVAAYITSREIGWDLVPPTVLRRDGPAGPGSVQLFVEADPERHYFTFSSQQKQRLRPAVLLDILMNNADRKGGHVLLDPDDHIWLIDHGLCFHQEPKLRTVIWDFAGEAIPEGLLSQVEVFRHRLISDPVLREAYRHLLLPSEMQALIHRAGRLLAAGHFPVEAPGRPFPWPLV